MSPHQPTVNKVSNKRTKQLLWAQALLLRPAPDREAEYCHGRARRSVCFRVSVFVREHISENTCSIFTNVLCMLPAGHLSPPVAALEYVMYFRFMHDVIFAHNGPCEVASIPLQ